MKTVIVKKSYKLKKILNLTSMNIWMEKLKSKPKNLYPYLGFSYPWPYHF